LLSTVAAVVKQVIIDPPVATHSSAVTMALLQVQSAAQAASWDEQACWKQPQSAPASMVAGLTPIEVHASALPSLWLPPLSAGPESLGVPALELHAAAASTIASEVPQSQVDERMR
jgi:hypothetical protein